MLFKKENKEMGILPTCTSSGAWRPQRALDPWD